MGVCLGGIMAFSGSHTDEAPAPPVGRHQLELNTTKT